MSSSTTKSTGKAAAHPTIADYGLVRGSFHYSYDEDFAFLSPFVGPGSHGWQEYEVLLPYQKNFAGDYGDLSPRNSECINYYIVSAPARAYITSHVKLVRDGTNRDSPRVTGMRYRDMVVDNYESAGGDMRTLRWMATKDVLHDPTRDLVKRAFERAGKDLLEAGSVEVYPGDQHYAGAADLNPFTKGHIRLLSENGQLTGGAFVKKFVYISEGVRAEDYKDGELQWGSPVVHIVTELGR
ncbi:hypothetical protein F5Y15DRAFT_422861 [Xylariaceae sp. FL0016]|nr:hypothetical protein F5Y15DRAFT_422861 [Xylariaceae sp. FL0016]